MTLDTVGQFLEQWWFLIVALGSMIWTLIKMYFGLKSVKEKMVELKLQLDHHDQQDKIMETNITSLIDRNKQTTETSTMQVQNKLEHIGNSITRLETLAELLVGEKKLK